MYSAYDNWHRGMIISRSASATISRGTSDRMQERGEGSSLGAIADEKMFLQSNGSGSGAGGRIATASATAPAGSVPFYKSLLSNLSKNNQTYTVNEE